MGKVVKTMDSVTNRSVVTMPETPPTRSVEEHKTAVLELASGAGLATESVPVHAAARRVLAEDLYARWDNPRFAMSAMDGFALRFADLGAYPPGLPVVAQIFAGDCPEPLAPGTAVRIMTGAAVPSGADTVVPFEQSHMHPGPLVTSDSAVCGAHIRLPGEDVRAGSLVLSAGTVLEPRHLGAVAAIGMDHVNVVQRPCVAVITTGDELLPAGEIPGAAHVIDSNGPYLVGALNRAGAIVSCFGCPDDPLRFQDIMDQASAYDLVVITGGASMGDRDVAREVLSRHGAHFFSVRMQPAKPQGAGRWEGGTPVLSLPGNPVSVAVSFAVFVRPLLGVMMGIEAPQPWWGTVSQGWKSIQGRCQFYPVSTEFSPTGETLIRPATDKGAGSHLVTSLTHATAFAIVPEGVSEVAAGDHLEILPVD